MGSANSNLNQSSEVGTLNWNDVNSENIISSKKLDDDIEEINLEIDTLSNSENSIEDLDNIFQKIGDEISKSEEKNIESLNNDKQDGSSPFISTELYNKIMKGGFDNETSPFLSSEAYNKIIKGGKLEDLSSSSSSSSISNFDEKSSTSSSDLLKALSQISVSSSDYPNKNNKNKKYINVSETNYNSKKVKKESQYGSSYSSEKINGYGFSESSSSMNKDSQKYFIGGDSSETPYKINSSSIQSSDINMVSVDSINGRRFLN